jgi:hypothetical protein
MCTWSSSTMLRSQRAAMRRLLPLCSRWSSQREHHAVHTSFSRVERGFPNLINTTDVAYYTKTVASKWHRPVIRNAYFDRLPYTTPVRPQQYLEFTEQDLCLGSTRGRANALANSKRAIDCQITNLLQALGMSASGSFPSKIAKTPRSNSCRSCNTPDLPHSVGHLLWSCSDVCERHHEHA